MVCTRGAGVGTFLCFAFGLFSILGIVGVTSQSSTSRKPPAAAQKCPGNPGEKKIICHMVNWSIFRPGRGKFTPENIDPFLCTHIIYLYAHLNSTTFLIQFSNPYADISLNTVQSLTNLKNQNTNLKVLIGIGGWEESASPKYSELIADSAKRARFNLDVIDFLRRNRFDGLELFWQFPGFPRGNRNNTTPNTVSEDRKNFALWVAELKQVFGCSILLCSMVPPDQEKSFEAYDSSIYQHLDWITILSYDYHGIWHDYTGYAAPLYSDQNVQVTVDVSVSYYIRYGVPLEKIIVGVASYGQSFTLDDPAKHDIGAPARRPGAPGPFTEMAGFLAFNEIFDQNLDADKKQQWTVVRNERLGTYAYKGDQWVSFDDPDMCRRKAEYVNRSNLGGISFSNIDMDTFQSPIGSMSMYGPFDLIRSARDVLISNVTKRSIEEMDSRNETYLVGMVGVTSRAQANRTQTAVAQQCPGNPGGKKIICHMQNWSVFRPGRGKFTPENIDPFLCTHIIYVYANLNATTFLIEFSDPYVDISLNTVQSLTNLKNVNPNLKVLIGIGGWEESASLKYSELIADPAKRSRFNSHALNFLSLNKFDGLELFWQFPGFPQGNRNRIPNAVNEDRKNFALWVAELKQAFGCSMLLSSMVPPDQEKSFEAYEPSVYQHLDWITILSYDYHGIWLDYTGYAAPLYSDQNVQVTVDVSVSYYIGYGVPLEKIIVGVASYGQSFTLDDAAIHGIGAPARRPGEPGPFTKQAGFLAFNEIFDQNLGADKGQWTVVRNENLGTYAYKGDQWVSFDDPDMCRRKAEYVNRSNLGGISFSNIDMDTFQSPIGSMSMYGPFDLIRSARDVLISNVTKRSIEEMDSRNETRLLGMVGATVTSQARANRTQTAVTQKCPGNLGGKKIICHMQNWSVFRPGRGKFTPENIDPFLCTHIIYVYANLNATTFLIEFSDPHVDISLNTVLTLTNIKNQNSNLKILIGIGGWEESASLKYSELIADPAKRSRFNSHALNFLSLNKFDGLELFWQFPGFPQGNRNRIPNAVNEDRKNFALWVAELKQVFGCSMLLSSMVPPDLEKSFEAYDPSIYQHLDWITILSYDYHGIWFNYTGYAAPLYSNQIVLMSVDVSANYYIRYGVPLEKIILGVASYGQSFTLDDPAMHGIGASARPGTPGPFTKQAGFLAFNEIFDQNLDADKGQQWTVVRNERLGTYAYKGDQWVSFDDPEMCRRKAEYVNRSNLGGISFSNIDMDTFQSPIGSRSKYGPFDLIRSARDVLISNVTAESNQESGSQNMKHLLVIIPLSVITTLALLGIVAGVVIYRRKIKILEFKLRELTKTEIDEFYNGNPNVNQHDINASIHAAPFDKKYELAEGHLIVERDKLLGSGQFGLVFRGNVLQSLDVEYANETTLVAVKTVKPDVDVEYFKALLSELKIMAYLGQHENVASLVGAQTDKIGNREIFVAIEFCAKGDLQRALKNGRGTFYNVFRTNPVFAAGEGDTDLDYHGNKDNNSTPLLTKTVKSKAKKYHAVSMKSDPNYVNDIDEAIITTMNLIEWARQISNGMAYLSSKKVIHGDLAARNILLTANNVAKISDFGLSRQLLNYSNYMKKTVLPLPWRWMAIESLRNMDFSVQSDVWSFGVTLWEIFSLGELPYPNLKWDQEFVDKLSQGKLRLQPPEYANSKIYELMLACWKKEPLERIHFETILIQLNQLLVALTSNVNADTNVEYISLFENSANQ